MRDERPMSEAAIERWRRGGTAIYPTTLFLAITYGAAPASVAAPAQ